MNLKRKTTSLLHHSWLWMRERKSLPLILCLLLVAVLSVHKADAKNSKAGVQPFGAKISLVGSNATFFDLDAADATSNENDDSNESDDQNDDQGGDETEDGPDDFWKTCHRAFLEISDYKEESKPSVITRSVQDIETLPLFILHCSWKSFLS